MSLPAQLKADCRLVADHYGIVEDELEAMGEEVKKDIPGAEICFAEIADEVRLWQRLHGVAA